MAEQRVRSRRAPTILLVSMVVVITVQQAACEYGARRALNLQPPASGPAVAVRTAPAQV